MTNVPEAAVHTATLPGINLIWREALCYAEKEEHPAGSHIYPYQAGDRSFYYLEKGRLTIMHGAANGQTRNMLYMQPGSLINVAYALGSFITSFLDAGCRFFCLSEVTLWKFPASLLRETEFVREHPDLIVNLMESIGLKLLLMHNILSYSGTGDATTTLCRFCLNMSQARQGQTAFTTGLSLAELANLLGIHRTSLFRSVRKLKAMGVILELSRERMVIGDMTALKKLASG